MMVFTYWVGNCEMRYYQGYNLMYYILAVVIFNIVLIGVETFFGLRKKYQKYKYDKAWEKHYKKIEEHK